MSVAAVDITGQRIELPAGPLADHSPVWVEARPNLRRSYVLAGDILAALGKRRDLAGKGRNQHHDLTLAAIWLRAHHSGDLVITDAQRLHPKILGTVCALAADAHVDLWLLHRPPAGDPFLRALHRRADTTKTFADVPRPVTSARTAAQHAPYPGVPRHDVHLFRAACQAQLAPEDRDTVLARFDHVAATAYRYLTEHGTTPAAVVALVEQILTDAPDDNQLLTDVRALQLAAWHHDTFLRVDPDTLLHSEERPSLPAAAVDEALAVYRQPHRILTCALTRRSYPLTDITALHVDDVRDDGHTLTIAGQTVQLPPAIAAAARAAALLRQHQGAAGTDPLLPYATQTLAAALTDATNDLGLHVKGRRAERTRPHHTAHLRRLGITLARLP